MNVARQLLAEGRPLDAAQICLDQFYASPKRWWMAVEALRYLRLACSDVANEKMIIFSPDYAGNAYQANLYENCSDFFYQAIPMNRLDINGALVAATFSKKFVFHQHWLKELYWSASDYASGMHSIDRHIGILKALESFGCEVVWTLHNLIDHDASDLQGRLSEYALREMAAAASRIFIHSSSAGALLSSHCGIDYCDKYFLLEHSLYDNLLLLPPDRLPKEIDLQQVSTRKVLLCMGMIRPYKGVPDLISAFCRIPLNIREQCHLIIAGHLGDSDVAPLLKTLDVSVRDRISFVGRKLKDEEMAALMKIATVAVMPYRKILTSGSFYLATTFSVPVLAPARGMFIEFIRDGENGFLYDGSSKGLADAIGRIVNVSAALLSEVGVLAYRENCHKTVSAVSSTLLSSFDNDCRGRDVVLSFCIPVMNRLSDLKATLRTNLHDNRRYQRRIEFLVVCFDSNFDTKDWIHENFKAELDTGYLRFFQSSELETWHFGKAKNAFKNLARGKIYASLDGDNFTGQDGGKHIIDVFEQHDYACVFHQFQGDWGDGTCGRVSMAMCDYKSIGYDNDFLPRQWDELDAILSILVNNESHKYICYKDKSIAKKSHPFGRFLRENGLVINTLEIDGALDPLERGSTAVSVGKHDSSYVQDDDSLKYSSIFNHLSSFYKNSRLDVKRAVYVGELVDVQRVMVEKLDIRKLFDWFLSAQQLETVPGCALGDITLVACVKNEFHLERWLAHYRRLGVTRFLLVDDGSTKSLVRRSLGSDVYVWKPICGRFRYSKAFWLELLLRRFASNCWSLTVDSDEYLDVPDFPWSQPDVPVKVSALSKLTNWGESVGYSYFPAALLDVFPPAGAVSAHGGAEALDIEIYTNYQFLDADAPNVYIRNNTVKWGFGPHASWSYSIDVRFQVNQAFDSLRKFPLFKMNADIHLNQGFHDLIIDGVKRTAADLYRKDLLSLVHYKLHSTQLHVNDDSAQPTDGYHQETRGNLVRLRKNAVGALEQAMSSHSSYRYLGHRLFPTPSGLDLVLKVDSTANSQGTYGDRVQREDDLVVNISSITEYKNGVLHAASLADGVAWVMANTPYKYNKGMDDQRAILSSKASKEAYLSLSMVAAS